MKGRGALNLKIRETTTPAKNTMSKPDHFSDRADTAPLDRREPSLKGEAERIRTADVQALDGHGRKETRRLVDELQVHQSELETQNVELRWSREELDTRVRYDDISEHRKTVKTLQESEDRFSKLFKQHSAVMLLLDPKTGRIVDANDAAARFYGWSLAELTQMCIQEINTLPPEEVQAEMQKAALSDNASFEFCHRRADGSIRDVEVFSNRIVTAETIFLFSIIHDITRRKLAEMAMRGEERYLRTILQTTVDGFWEVNFEGKITRVNEAYCRMSGYTREELLQLDLFAIDAIEKPGQTSARIRRIIANGSEIFETVHRRKDGSLFHVELSVTFVNEGGGKFVCFCRDLTEKKRAAEALRQSEARLHSAYERLQNANEELQAQNKELVQLWEKSQRTERDLNKANRELGRQAAALAATNISLENEKRLLATVMDALPTGVVITDKSGGVILANKAYDDIWGEPRPETCSVEDYAAYKAWWDDTDDPVEPDEWASAIAVRKNQTTIGQLMRIQRFDGSHVFIINSAAPVHDIEGRIIGSAVAVQDVTKLKEVERALLDNKKDFSCAQEVGGIGSWRVDIRRNVLSWSDESYRIFGIPMGGPLTYEKLLFRIHPDDRSSVEMRWKALLRGEPYDFEYRLVIDGRIKWVREKASPEFDKAGKVSSGFGITQDITRLRQTEKALYESEQRLRLFIEHAPVALAMFDRQMRYLSSSRRWSSDFELGNRDLRGLSIYEVYEISEKWREAHRRGLAGEVLGEEEELIERPDGSNQWIRWEIRPWRNSAGDIGGIIIYTEDITERRQIQQQLETLNVELEKRVESRTLELQETQSQYMHAEKLSAIGKLSASIAHEFNNPLQGIMSILKGLRKRAILDEEDRELLEAAISESERIRDLIQNLQDFNRPSSGRKMVMDVHKSLDSLLMLCKNDFKNKRISVVRNYAERLPQIIVISDQIKQVFLNLLNNAADACLQPGGVITISTRQEGKRIAVAIKDTGIGIAADLKGQIFQPFYTTKREIKGTGLGLSICHGIVNRHQGEIQVESEPDKGATFTVLLPIKGE